jgi:hypothetical protein
MSTYSTQNDLLLTNLISFYKKNDNLNKMLLVVTGESKVSLRIVDWFATNYAKKYYIVYEIKTNNNDEVKENKIVSTIPDYSRRFKVYNDYKLKLKAYSKRRFDPFCRWDRITIPYKENSSIQTTIGQLNFFKWVIENNIIQYIEQHYDAIENDMNGRNSTSKKKETVMDASKTRKRREELSISATKSIKTEDVEITLSFK